MHTFEDFLSQAEIKSYKKDKVGSESVKTVIDNFSTLIVKERAILSKAADVNDEGTVSQMSDYITETEKTLWMLNSYMG